MTIYYITNNNDYGFGSLRYGIELTKINNIIFSDNYQFDMIHLNSTIEIKRNITIINNSNINIKIKGNNDSIFTFQYKDVKFTINGNIGISLIDTITHKEGGAIKNLFINNSINLENVYIHNCHATYGGAIFTFGYLKLSKCSFMANSAQYIGGAIFSYNTINIDNCKIHKNIIISENEYIGGAGLFVCADKNTIDLSFNISNTIISNNFIKFNPDKNSGISGAGIMILIFNNTLYFNNCVIENNLSKNGSGIMVINGNIDCLKCEIKNNMSSNYDKFQYDEYKDNILTGGGCGITSINGNININNCNIIDNKSYGIYSSGIASFNGDITCANSNISNNINNGYGKAITTYLNCELIINDSYIIENDIVNFFYIDDNKEKIKLINIYINYFNDFVIYITMNLLDNLS
jgi:hypothetical protein